MTVSWAFVLRPVDGGRTRLLLRARNNVAPMRLAGLLESRSGWWMSMKAEECCAESAPGPSQVRCRADRGPGGRSAPGAPTTADYSGVHSLIQRLASRSCRTNGSADTSC